MAINSNFPLVTYLQKLCKAACCATHYGSSDTSASACQNWSTKVYVNKPTTIQALKEEIRRCIINLKFCFCPAKLWLKISLRRGHLPDVLSMTLLCTENLQSSGARTRAVNTAVCPANHLAITASSLYYHNYHLVFNHLYSIYYDSLLFFMQFNIRLRKLYYFIYRV